MSAESSNERKRLPEWFKIKLPSDKRFAGTGARLRKNNLRTICEEARCPNRAECWSCGTATFLLMGPACTRACRYCNVGTDAPSALDDKEPGSVALAARDMGLKYVVITSVTRDDLPDGGAAHFSKTIKAVREMIDGSRIEVLVPDFMGIRDSVMKVVDEKPYVFGHNVETVEALFPELRPQGDFNRTLKVLELVKNEEPSMITKSGIMLGLGETDEQVLETLKALYEAGVDRVTMGQYLQPASFLAPVDRFVTPEEFRQWENEAYSIGFKWVKAAPNVRSSYHAEQE